MNSNTPAPWNIIQTVAPECPPPTRAPRKHSLRGWFQGGGCRAEHDGGWGTMTTPSTYHPRKLHFRGTRCIATPPMEGNLVRSIAEQSSPLRRGGAKRRGGQRVQEHTLSPLTCHSRAGGNDRGESARAITKQNAHRHRVPRKHSLRGWFQGGGCRASRDGGWGTMTTPPRNKVPLCGGVARSAGVVYSLLVTRDSLFVCVSLGRVAPCAYPRICSNCAVACFHILGFIASKAWRSSK